MKLKLIRFFVREVVSCSLLGFLVFNLTCAFSWLYLHHHTLCNSRLKVLASLNEFAFIALRMTAWPPLLWEGEGGGQAQRTQHASLQAWSQHRPEVRPSPTGPLARLTLLRAHESKLPASTGSFCAVRYVQKFLKGCLGLSRAWARSDSVCWGCREPVPAPARLCLPTAGSTPAAGTQPA